MQIEQDRMASENRMLSDEKRNLETRLNHTESELNVCEMTKEHLRNDKTIVSTSVKCDFDETHLSEKISASVDVITVIFSTLHR